MSEEDTIKLRGYLRHKGKKRLISMWRQWYCVLNGHLLLFYRSETDYTKLAKFHDQIDLGLVYDVLPALGVENGIQISTHVGPHWLRCKDEKSCQQWLESLQASIVLRRQATLRRTKADPATASENKPSKSVFSISRQQKAKSTVPEYYLIQNKDATDVEDNKKASPLARLSLSFIPGHGKKYSTFDSHRSCRTAVGDVIAEDKDEDRGITVDDLQTSSPVKSRLKKEWKEPRPLSESVSDFLLLNVSEPKETQMDDQLEVVRKKNNKTHAPRLPTSFNVGKLLSHLEVVPKNKSSSKSMNNLVEHSCQSESTLSQSSSQIDATLEKPRLPSTSKSDDVLAKRASDIIGQRQSVTIEEPKEINDKVDVTHEKVANQNQDDVLTTPIEAEPEKKNKQVRKIKEPSRRKSGLAMLRQFFQSAKTGINKLKGENKQERTLSVSPQSSRKNSREDNSLQVKHELAAVQQTVNIVDDPLPEESIHNEPKLEKQISDGSAQSVKEENFTAESTYVLEAKALEVCEPEAIDVTSQLSTVDVSVNSPEVAVPTVSIGKSRDSYPSREQHQLNRNSIQSNQSLQEEDVGGLPSIPIKTKMKCPSPVYDVPRSNPIPISNYLAVDQNKDNTWLDKSPQSNKLEFGEILTITTTTDDETTDNSSTVMLDESQQLRLPSNSDQLTQMGSRLSYALSETEIVLEEAAETIDESTTS